MFQYAAKLIKVVDGDTVDLKVDLGFKVSVEERFRLYGINAPELHSVSAKEKAAAVESKVFLESMLANKSLTVTTYKDKQEKYGRFLAVITVDGDLKSVNAQMVEAKLAKAYTGGVREPFSGE